MSRKKLEWEDKYSVGVVEIDNQHKRMFAVINELLDSISNNDPEEHLTSIIEGLLQYKKFHFATEEKYFKEFNYEGTAEHVAKHLEFGKRLDDLKQKYPSNTIEFAFALADFLEDWLIDHLLVMDQKYKQCFKEHGLK